MFSGGCGENCNDSGQGSVAAVVKTNDSGQIQPIKINNGVGHGCLFRRHPLTNVPQTRLLQNGQKRT